MDHQNYCSADLFIIKYYSQYHKFSFYHFIISFIMYFHLIITLGGSNSVFFVCLSSLTILLINACKTSVVFFPGRHLNLTDLSDITRSETYYDGVNFRVGNRISQVRQVCTFILKILRFSLWIANCFSRYYQWFCPYHLILCIPYFGLGLSLELTCSHDGDIFAGGFYEIMKGITAPKRSMF